MGVLDITVAAIPERCFTPVRVLDAPFLHGVSDALPTDFDPARNRREH
ncbi:hypothetical protein [Actinomadura meridiana]